MSLGPIWPISRERGNEERGLLGLECAYLSLDRHGSRRGIVGKILGRLLHKPHLTRPGIEGRGDEVPGPLPQAGTGANARYTPCFVCEPESQSSVADDQGQACGDRI